MVTAVTAGGNRNILKIQALLEGAETTSGLHNLFAVAM